jgi:hypothetical protein
MTRHLHSIHPCTGRGAAGPDRASRRQRRGVASVLSMMFLVVFGSLAAAMAVVAQGNLRTADSALKVSRAMSAAETGLVFATRRMAEQAGRFVVEKGVIDTHYAEDIWVGTVNTGSDGTVDVLPPDGFSEGSDPPGILFALTNAHTADTHNLSIPGYVSSPTADVSTGTLLVPPVAVTPDGEDGPYFTLRYDMVEGSPEVRVTSEGVDGDITRTLSMHFRIDKKIEYAILSPNRIMIGKNVMVEGPLGSRFGIVAGELDTDNGDPLVMRSDFYYLADALTTKLDTLYSQVTAYDVDGDGRLRPDHPVEGGAFTGFPTLVDHDGDEYVDDFDMFLSHFDANGNGMVPYDNTLTAEVGLGTPSLEFAGIDDQLMRLIDEARPDRDGDGAVTDSDRLLGYRDGVVDAQDLYAKVVGHVAFAVAQSPWELAHGESYQTVVQGPVRPTGPEDAPVTFEVSDEELLDLTTEMFNTSQTWFETQVVAPTSVTPGNPPLDAQVVADAGAGGTYTPADDDRATGTWESVPFEAFGPYDYYARPTYEDMTFNNLRIPMGNNGLYINCTFIGVTYIEAAERCDDTNWNIAGSVWPVPNPITGDITYEDHFPDYPTELEGTPVTDSRWYSNNLRFHNCTFLGSLAGDRLDEYTHWRNKIQMTGNTRFYLDPTDEELDDQPDKATLVAHLNGITAAERQELGKSSILMPGWSVDVGNFTNDVGVTPSATPTVNLRGTIVAGILDVRGTADVFGTVLMTFRPTSGAGPLFFGGQVDSFNTTIGYFGPADGDNEGIDPDDPDFPGFGEIRLRYNPDALLPDGIPWPLQMAPVADTYVEGTG